jgi:hypothetical protein
MESLCHYYSEGMVCCTDNADEIMSDLTGKKIKLINNTPFLDKVRLYVSDDGSCFMKFITKSKEAMIELYTTIMDVEGWNIVVEVDDTPDLYFTTTINLISKNKKFTGYKKGHKLSIATEDIRKIDVMDTEEHMKHNALSFAYD